MYSVALLSSNVRRKPFKDFSTAGELASGACALLAPELISAAKTIALWTKVRHVETVSILGPPLLEAGGKVQNVTPLLIPDGPAMDCFGIAPYIPLAEV